MKKGHFDSKKGGNASKNWNQILRPAINEWRPKKKFEKWLIFVHFLIENIIIMSQNFKKTTKVL